MFVLNGLKMKNPVIVASGPLTYKLEFLKEAERCKAGGASLKLTFKYVPFPGQMRSFSLPDNAIVHAIDKRLNLEQGIELAREAREHTSLILYANIGATGDNIAEWCELAAAFEEAGVHALELNFCCPNLDVSCLEPGTRDEHGGSDICQHPEQCYEITRQVKAVSNLPVVCKFVPNALDVRAVARACQDGGADAVHVVGHPITGLPPVDVFNGGRPLVELVNGVSFGAVNGSVCRYSTFQVIAQIAQVIDIPIIASGGLDNWQDCISAISWGASAVSLCSAPMWYGFKVIQEITEDIEDFITQNGYNDWNDFRGMSLKYITSPDKIVVLDGHAQVDKEKCIACGRCLKPGHCDAITMCDGKANIDPDLCIACGVCPKLCPTDAITMVMKDLAGDATR